MKKLTFLFLSLIIIIKVNAQDDCFQVLQLSSRNYTSTERIQITASSVYKNHCGSSSSSASIGLGIDSSTTSKLLSDVFGLSGTASKSAMSQFCENYESGMYGREEFSKSTNLVVESAIRAWSDCQKMKNENIRFQIQDAGDIITFSLKQRSGRTIYLNGVNYNKKCMSCIISKGKKTTIADSTSQEKISNDKTLNITCTRKRTASGDEAFYPNTAISINTDQGSLVIPIPEKITAKYKWLNEFSDKLDILNNKLNIVSKEKDSLINSIATELESNYIKERDIIFGGLKGSNSFNGNVIPKKVNLFVQSNGTLGINWVKIDGSRSNVFIKGEVYKIHIQTNLGYQYVGTYEYNNTSKVIIDFNKMNRDRGVSGTITYMSFIAIRVRND